jgi:hypothetical protein
MAPSRHKVTVERCPFHLADKRRAGAAARWHRYYVTMFATWAAQRAANLYPMDWDRDDEERLLIRRYHSEVGRKTTTRGRPGVPPRSRVPSPHCAPSAANCT